MHYDYHFVVNSLGEITSENHPQRACWLLSSCFRRSIVSVPIWLLYEASIWIVKGTEKK